MAAGEYVGFLNAADVFADETVLDKVAYALQARKWDAVCGDLVYVRQSEPNAVVRYWKSRPYEAGRVESELFCAESGSRPSVIRFKEPQARTLICCQNTAELI